MNSHRYMIEFIKNEIKGKIDVLEESDFRHKIKGLKHFREESDYQDLQINRDKSEEALRLATDIRKFLHQNFHL